ncbi:MAG: sulfurtransferase [Pseudomonadota bacterium]|nr:sulfurtransferase [Pseudomonadota bacterium]
MTFTTLIDAESLRGLVDGSAASAALAVAGRPGLAARPGLASRPAVLLDCRFDLSNPAAGHQAYVTAHIPGAFHADLNRHLAAPVTADSGRHPLPSAGGLREFFGALGIGDDTQVIAYDDANGSLAARAWWLLRWLGHFQVAVLDGGFKAWVASGGAVERGEPVRAAAPGVATGLTTPLRPETVVSTADVSRALRDPNRLLVDARAAERFAGSVEPLDPVAGHVPGAVNHPFSSNLESDGRFLPAAELRRRWLERLDGTAPGDVVLMCGSGVTACHDLLAMEIAGLPGAVLYAGSWSEWIRDPQRPVARGND